MAAILELSNELLRVDGYAAIVSEFFFQDIDDLKAEAMNILLERLGLYWTKSNTTFGGKALLFTNEHPISTLTYAERRADSLQEATIWLRHLERERIAGCSPGLLYIQKRSAPCWRHSIVPKSTEGSIWTPSNIEAMTFTQSRYRDFFAFTGT